MESGFKNTEIVWSFLGLLASSVQDFVLSNWVAATQRLYKTQNVLHEFPD